MNGNKWALGGTVAAASIAAFASAYSAYASLSATREAAAVTASAAVEVEKLRKQNSDRQSDIEMVKLALNILGGEVSDKTHESRLFAVSLLQKYSGVQIDAASSQSWAENGTVRFSDTGAGLSSMIHMSEQTAAAMASVGLLEKFVLELHRKSSSKELKTAPPPQ